MNEPDRSDLSAQRVSNIELFFDLVFLLAVTQITGLVAHPQGPLDYARALLVFLTLMWIYDVFAWAASKARERTGADHGRMGITMAAFLTMSLGIPTAFGAGGLVYGGGLLVATLVHAATFHRASGGEQTFQATLPNVLAALLVLGAAFVPEPWKTALWVLAAVYPAAAALARRDAGFAVDPGHFVERNGLLVIVALGESVVGVGQGARGLPLDPPLLAYAALGLCLGLCLWRAYFTEDEERVRRTMEASSMESRNRLALVGHGFAHFAIIGGIILAAAGTEAGVGTPMGRAGSAAAWNLAAGVALFLAGNVAYRRTMGIESNRVRLGVAALALPTALLGTASSAILQLGACCVLLTSVWVVDNRSGREERASLTP